MQDINQLHIVGRLGRDPVVHKTKDGNDYAILSLVTSEERYIKSTKESKTKNEWHDVFVWPDHIVNFVRDNLHKGDTVQIIAPIRYLEEKDAQGIYSKKPMVSVEHGSILNLFSSVNKAEEVAA